MTSTTLGLGCFRHKASQLTTSNCWGACHPAVQPCHMLQTAGRSALASLRTASTGACSSSDLVREEAACQSCALLSADLAVSTACSGCWACRPFHSEQCCGMYADAA